jgi:hypothetical protein
MLRGAEADAVRLRSACIWKMPVAIALLWGLEGIWVELDGWANFYLYMLRC